MTWLMFLSLVVVIYIGLGVVIPFGFVIGYSGYLRTKIQYIKSLTSEKENNEGGEEEKEENNRKHKPTRHMHGAKTTKQQ